MHSTYTLSYICHMQYYVWYTYSYINYSIYTHREREFDIVVRRNEIKVTITMCIKQFTDQNQHT